MKQHPHAADPSAATLECPLSGVKRTLIGHAAMSAFDPKRTLGSQSASI
jgi:hypothetical protein